MRVVSVAFPFAPVGPDAVGGAEQVLWAMDRALTEAGHESVVVAQAGSSVSGRLAAIAVPEGAAHLPGPARDAVHRQVAQRAGELAADVVHMHGIDFASCLPPPGPPVLATLHLPVSWYPPAALAPARPATFLHGVSASQHRLAPPGLALLPPVENGIDVAALQARHARRGFALMLGRICPEKGQHLGLQAARAAGVTLLVAGLAFPYPEHQEYLDRQVRPLLDRCRRLIGPAGLARKRRLLSAARCLLVPSQAPETSSLVAMEAAACGTPVIAWRSGALPDIVRHGVTGFVVDSIADMTEAIAMAGRIDPDACRARARSRFTQARMVAGYLDRYRTVLGR